MNIQKLVFLSFTLLNFVSQSYAETDLHQFRFPVTKHVLANGLTVLFHVDHSVPTVSYHTWFRVGSKDEELGFTGIAHLFEHMMFKGGKRYPAGFEKLLQSNGISNNAFTTYDYTGYFEELPPSKLELVIDFEADRLENLSINTENLKSEREVVKEERRWRVDNSIMGLLNEKLWSIAFQVHPYKWPVIGWMKDLNNITLEKCLEFFKMYYSAPNAIISVSGDFDPEKALKLIEKYYGHLPKINIKRRPIKFDPPQTEERRALVQRPAQSEQIFLAYHIGQQGEPESFVMDLIANILAEGESSRLYKKFVYQDQTVVNVGGASFTPQHPGLFQVYADLRPKVAASLILPKITLEIEKIVTTGVTQKELDKAKNQIMKQWIDAIKTAHGKARALALNEAVTGNYENLFDDLKEYQKITVKDVQRVAAKYLKTSNRTVVTLIPSKDKK